MLFHAAVNFTCTYKALHVTYRVYRRVIIACIEPRRSPLRMNLHPHE